MSMTLEQARDAIGKRVTYARYDDPKNPTAPTAGPAYGVITSVNARYVFVRYGTDVIGTATDPDNLTLETP